MFERHNGFRKVKKYAAMQHINSKKHGFDMLACQTVLFEFNIARIRAFLTFLT